MSASIKLVQCLYCTCVEYDRGRKRPSWMGKFKVKETSRNFLVFECPRCKRRFYYRFMGRPLRDVDMDQLDKEVQDDEVVE